MDEFQKMLDELVSEVIRANGFPDYIIKPQNGFLETMIHQTPDDSRASRIPTIETREIWRKIIEQPGSRETRLIFADALEDAAGDHPYQAEGMLSWAELIRKQSEHALRCPYGCGIPTAASVPTLAQAVCQPKLCQARDVYAICKKIMKRTVKTWNKYFNCYGKSSFSRWLVSDLPVTNLPYAYVVIRSGMVDEIGLTLQDFYHDNGRRFVRSHPLRRIIITDRTPDTSPHVADYRDVDGTSDISTHHNYPMGWHWNVYDYNYPNLFFLSPSNTLPPKLYQYVEEYARRLGIKTEEDGKGWIAGSAVSRLLLSWACIRHARSCEGLPLVDPMALDPLQ